MFDERKYEDNPIYDNYHNCDDIGSLHISTFETCFAIGMEIGC